MVFGHLGSWRGGVCIRLTNWGNYLSVPLGILVIYEYGWLHGWSNFSENFWHVGSGDPSGLVFVGIFAELINNFVELPKVLGSNSGSVLGRLGVAPKIICWHRVNPFFGGKKKEFSCIGVWDCRIQRFYLSEWAANQILIGRASRPIRIQFIKV